MPARLFPKRAQKRICAPPRELEVHLQARIEGGSVVPLTPKLNGQVIVWSAFPPASGVALSLDAAQRAHVVRTCRDMGFVALAAVLGAALFFVPRDELVTCIVVVLATLGVLLLIAAGLSERWRKDAEMFAADMPAAGTPVRIDDTGLTIGPVTTRWESLKLASVSLRKVRSVNGQMFRRYFVDQVLLDTDGGRVALDGAAITQGQRIVDTIFTRLCPMP
jgi:hypothetical protein